MQTHRMSVVPLDGARGTGKSALASGIRSRFGCAVLDLGPVFRLIAWLRLQEPKHELRSAINILAAGIASERFEIQLDRSCGMAATNILIEGRPAEGQLWAPALAEELPEVSNSQEAISAVREISYSLVGLRRTVVVGRQAGRTFFPNAHLKIFLSSDAEARRSRKQRQLEDHGYGVDAPSLERLDLSEVACEAEGAVTINTTRLSAAALLDLVSSLIISNVGWKAMTEEATS